MKEHINVNAPPNSPKPEYKPMQQVKEYQGYGQLTNAEIYGALALILMELEKINNHLDKLLEEKPMKVDLVEYNLRPPYTIT